MPKTKEHYPQNLKQGKQMADLEHQG